MTKYIEERQNLHADRDQLRKELEDNRKEHQTHVSDLERKHVQEKDRLKKEMLLKLRETKANLLKMTDNQLDTTTKRTIAENEQMSSELAWQVCASSLHSPPPHARLHEPAQRACACADAPPVPVAVEGDGEADPEEREAGRRESEPQARAVAPPADRGGVCSQGKPPPSLASAPLLAPAPSWPHAAVRTSCCGGVGPQSRIGTLIGRRGAGAQVHVYQKTIKTLLAKLNSMDSHKRADVERRIGEGGGEGGGEWREDGLPTEQSCAARRRRKTPPRGERAG